MTPSPCRWLFDELGTERAVRLSTTLKARTRAHIEEVLGARFRSYSPFMCVVDSAAVVAPLYDVVGDPLLVTDADALRAIEATFRGLRTSENALTYSGVMTDPEILQRRGPAVHALVASAVSLLARAQPDLGRQFQSIVDLLIPLRHPDDQVGIEGGSTQFARGAIYHWLPDGESGREIWHVARELAHELGHQVLMVYQVGDELLESPPDAPVFSAVRRTTRPAMQALQAATALAYMTLFQAGALELVAPRQLDRLTTERATLDELVDGLATTLDGLRKTCTFSQLGTAIVADLDEALARGRTAREAMRS